MKFDAEALQLISHIGDDTSLRYALNLIAPAQLLAQRRKKPVVEVEDVRKAYVYFMDHARSAMYARETSGMMFGEEEPVRESDRMEQDA